jgi:salicylate hydroxylase
LSQDDAHVLSFGDKSLKVSIAGAGISGLASAIALARNAHDITVHDQAARIETVGAGLQLGPNAVRVLQALGVWDHLEDQCVAPARIRICDAANGNQLSVLELGDSFAKQFGAPYRVAHRADLINALAKTAESHENISINLSHRVTGLDLTGDPELLFMSGQREAAGLVVAADGIRSPLRNHIAPGHDPRISGETLYRALAPASALPEGLDPEAVYLWLGPGAHVVHYPVSGGRRLNIVASIEVHHEMPGWNAPASRDTVLEAMPNITTPLKRCLEAPASWLAWAGADLEPFNGWSRGSTVLVGDAAHGTLPYLAQGAAMALEDATSLADEIGNGDDVPDALVRFEARRQPRTARITLGSRRNAKIYHMAGPAAVARNLALRALPRSIQLRRLSFIYSWPHV